MIRPPVIFFAPNATPEDQAFKTSWWNYWKTSSIANMFSATGELAIRAPAGDYTRTTNGDSNNYVDGYTTAYIQVATRRIGFDLTIKDTRDDIYLCLKELADYCIKQTAQDIGYAKTMVVYDFHRMEDRIDRDRGYAIRTGNITLLDGAGGTILEGYSDCEGNDYRKPGGTRFNAQGFKVSFLQVAKGEGY